MDGGLPAGAVFSGVLRRARSCESSHRLQRFADDDAGFKWRRVAAQRMRSAIPEGDDASDEADGVKARQD
jgi:hypothetical protein